MSDVVFDSLIVLKNRQKCIVDEKGRYTDEAGSLRGLEVLTEGNKRVLEILKTEILSVEKYIHSYPYDWRTKKPVILRASRQWFIDTNSLKEKAVVSHPYSKILSIGRPYDIQV